MKKKFSKYQKVAPKLNKRQKVTYSPRRKVVIKRTKRYQEQFHMKKKLSKLSKHQKEASKTNTKMEEARKSKKPKGTETTQTQQ
jgi:hypothetical protein